MWLDISFLSQFDDLRRLIPILRGHLAICSPVNSASLRPERGCRRWCGKSLKELTKAGLDAAHQEERVGGRRPKLSPQQPAEIGKMVSKGRKPAADAARLFKIHPATVSRLLAQPYAK